MRIISLETWSQSFVARTVHFARQLGEPLVIDAADVDTLYARYQGAYGQEVGG